MSEKASGFCNQVIIYSKHHYGSTGDTLSDLKHLLAQYASLDVENITDYEVLRYVIGAFNYFVTSYDRTNAMIQLMTVIAKDISSTDAIKNNRDIMNNYIDIMLSSVANSCLANDFDISKKANVLFKRDLHKEEGVTWTTK